MENREVLQLISLLIQYPNKDLVEYTFSEEMKGITNSDVINNLNYFIEYLNSFSLDELAEKYVQTFDFNEKTNLYLTYSKFKDEKERGEILVKLKRIYEDEGFIMTFEELPDYLPLFLEFLSIAKEETVKELIFQLKDVFENLEQELKQSDSPYSMLINTCLIVFNENYSQ